MNELLEKALAYEEENKIDESEKYFLKALDQYPNDKEVLFYSAIFLFKKGDYERSLDLFIQSYNHIDQSEMTREDLLNHILVAYYQPHEEALEKKYNNNVQTLLAYEHNYIKSFVAFADLPYLCIRRNDSAYYIFDKQTKKIKNCIILEEIAKDYPDISIEDCIIVTNIFDCINLEKVEKQTRNPTWVNNIKVPIYLVWQDRDKMEQYLQVSNYEMIIALNRFVIFADYSDESGLKAFLEDHQAYLFNKFGGDTQYFEQIKELISQVKNTRQQDIARKTQIVNQMTQQYDKKYYKKLFSGSYDKIRILFYTSRFTKVVQYGTRDFMKACEELGIECDIVIDKSDIHGATGAELVNKIAEFKPNIIFRINFFKSDYKEIPPNIIFISWIQDLAYQINSRAHAEQFDWSDFALTYTRNWRQQMIKTGYDKSRIAVQIVPIDEKIFYKRDMSREDTKLYTADISFAGNYSRPEKSLADMIIKYTNEITDVEMKSRVTTMLLTAYDTLRSKISNGELIYREEQCEMIVDNLSTILEIKIEVATAKQIAQDFFFPLCYHLHRKITLKWLIDEGFQVKLWGRDWDTDSDFAANAMGLLTHGDDLAKMYSCTKIVPGTFFWTTAHFRCWESTSCGALSINRYVPEEFDLANIRDYFTEDEHFAFYQNKQELINKVKYYLANEDERKRIVENGKQKILQTMTYSGAVSKCLNLIKENMVNR